MRKTMKQQKTNIMKNMMEKIKSFRIKINPDKIFRLSIIAFLLAVTIFIIAKLASAVLVYVLWGLLGLMVLSGLFVAAKKLSRW